MDHDSSPAAAQTPIELEAGLSCRTGETAGGDTQSGSPKKTRPRLAVSDSIDEQNRFRRRLILPHGRSRLADIGTAFAPGSAAPPVVRSLHRPAHDVEDIRTLHPGLFAFNRRPLDRDQRARTGG